MLGRFIPSVLRFAFFLVPVAALLGGCGGSDDDAGGDPGTLQRLFSYPEIQACGTCHGPGGSQAGGPDMTTPSSFFNDLVAVGWPQYQNRWIPGPTRPCSNAGFPYVSPGNPNGSALLAAVTFPYAAGKCEGTWSFHDTQRATLDDNQNLIDDLVLWIVNGARP